MSLEATIGRIDSIIQLQQQILDPSAATTTSSATAAGATAAGATAASPASTAGDSTFATMLAGAQQSTAQDAIGDTSAGASAVPTGLTDPISAGVTPSPYGGATGVDPTGTAATGATGATNAPGQVQAMVDEANSLVGKPYVWGGGHSGWGPQRGYDCSGFVSAVLHAGGCLSSPQDTVTLPSAPGMARGPGQYVTVYDRTGAAQEGHVIIEIDGQFYESGGGHGAWGGGGGVEKIGRPSAAYLATFDTQLHPQGL